MTMTNVLRATAICAALLTAQSAFAWGCKIEDAGRKAAEPDHPLQSRVNLYVGEVGVWGDLKVRTNQLQANEWVEVDVKGPQFAKHLRLVPNKPEPLEVCGKDILITANGIGNGSATIIVSAF